MPPPGPAPDRPAPPRPTVLTFGAIAAVFCFAAAAVECVFWFRVNRGLADWINSGPSSAEAEEDVLRLFENFSIIIVVLSAATAAVVMFGGVFTMTGKGGGRMAIWIAGGIAIAWHLCCNGYTFLFRQAFTDGEFSDGSTITDRTSIDEHVAVWWVDVAVVSGFLSAIGAILAIVFVAQASATQYFRALNPPLMMPYYPPGYGPSGYPPPGPGQHWPRR